MKAFILVFIPFLVTYFYLTYQLIASSDLEQQVHQTAAKAHKDLNGYSEDILNDLKKCYVFVLVIIGASALFAFIWILFLKYNAKLIVWVSIFSLPLLISISLYYSIKTYIHLLKQNNSKDKDDEAVEDFTVGNSPNQELGFEKAFQTIITAEFLSYVRNETLWLTITIVLSISIVILVVLLHILRRRVRLAIALIRQASKAINGVKSTLFFPLIPRTVGFCVIIYGIVVALLIITAGHPTYRVVGGNDHGKLCNKTRSLNKTTSFVAPQNEYIDKLRVPKPNIWPGDSSISRLPNQPPPQISLQQLDLNTTTTKPKCLKHYLIPRQHIWKCHLFNIFAILWMIHFISGIAQTTLAGAFASYYWAFKKPDDVPFFAVTSSFYRVIRFHLGDIAFGSFLMASIRYIRIVIELITNRFRRTKQNSTDLPLVGHNTVKNMGCFLRAFFWLLDRFLKYIDRNAYIMMSMYGESYLDSAKKAVKLLYKNSTRALVLDYVTYFVLLVSRLLITGLAGYLSHYLISPLDLKYKWLPIVMVIVGSYFIAKGLFNVYGMAVDTLFICFLIDSDNNDGSAERPYFMPKDLRRIVKRSMKKG